MKRKMTVSGNFVSWRLLHSVVWLSFSVFDGVKKLKIENWNQFSIFVFGQRRAHSKWQKYPRGRCRKESFVLFPSPSRPWRNVVRSRSRGNFGAFSQPCFSLVASLPLWQAARYWTFHARERIFDFASQRLTWRYPDFLERFRQVNVDDFVAYDFVVFRLRAAMSMSTGSIHVSKLWQFKLKFEVKARAEMCEWKERYFLLRAKVVQSSCGSDERCTQHA